MALISEEVLFPSTGVIEKTSGEDTYTLPVLEAIYLTYGGDNDEKESGLLVRGGRGMFYPVAKDALSVDEAKGTIEFSSYDGTYVIRKFQESDSEWFSNGIPLTPQMMEEIMAKDEEVGVEQSVEALSDPESGEVVAVVYDVENLGTFFRIDGKWVAATPEQADKFDGSNIIDIEYDKAQELVDMWDAGDTILEGELAPYAKADSEEDTE